MTEEERITMICIDIGMTRSATSWRDNQHSRVWEGFFKGAKIPTRVAYAGNDAAPPVAWGKACSRLPVDPHITVRECFKTSMDENSPHNTTSKTHGGSTRAADQRCMLDFIHLICKHITAVIDDTLGVSWQLATIHWMFCVPGSWAELPTLANFKRLAEDAIYRCIGDREGSKVFTRPTEALASAHCLLKNGSASSTIAYTPGNMVLSCDIRGSITDIAVTQIIAPGLLKAPMQLNLHPAGGTTVDACFLFHVQKTLESAGVSDSTNIAQGLSSGQFSVAKENFTLRNIDVWVPFLLPRSCEVRNWCPSVDAMSIETKICEEGDGPMLMIHWDTMTQFFTPFIVRVEGAIDEAINRLKDKKTHRRLTAIGICGGGSRMTYPIQRLRRRYGEGLTFLDHNDYEFPPWRHFREAQMLCDQQLVINFCGQMRFGIKGKKDGVFWGELTEVQTALDFQTPYSMEVHFNASTYTIFKPVEHDLIALPRSAADYSTFSEASRDTYARTWKVRVDIAKVKKLPFSLIKKYKVICRISGVWEIETVAEAGTPIERIDCEML